MKVLFYLATRIFKNLAKKTITINNTIIIILYKILSTNATHKDFNKPTIIILLSRSIILALVLPLEVRSSEVIVLATKAKTCYYFVLAVKNR